MKHTFGLYLIVTCILVSLDMIWLLGIARSLYASQLGSLLTPTPNIWAASIFYLLYPIGIITFAIHPASPKYATSKTIPLGALFGFLAYATYDLTNLATLSNWPLFISVIDIFWGTILTATTTALASLRIRNMTK